MRYVSALCAAFIMVAALRVAASDAVASHQDWLYRIQPGDTVWDLSRDLLKDWRAWGQLIELNGIHNERAIRPGSLLRIPVSMLALEDARITVDATSGVVQRRRVDAAGLAALSAGELLRPGEAVVTGSGASVRLRFEDSTSILVLENSELAVHAARVLKNRRDVLNIKLSLNAGEVEIDSHRIGSTGSYFLIETPSAYATTRGTRYRVRAQARQTFAEVTRGLIGVANAKGDIHVREGFGVRIAKGQQPTRPQPLLPAPALDGERPPVLAFPYRLEWAPQAGAVAYRLQLAEQPEFSALALDQVVAEPAFDLPASLPDRSYSLRLAAIDANGLQGYWGHGRLEVHARSALFAPGAPVLAAPSLSTGRAHFSWDRSAHAVVYQFQLARDPGFADIGLEREQPETQMSLEAPEPDAYFVRVRGIDQYGHAGEWSAAQQLEVPRDRSGLYFLLSVVSSVLLL